MIRADATSGAITMNLPTAVGIAGREYHIFRTDILSSTNLITIDANSTETIDSNLTYILYPGEYVKIESDGANWQVLGRPTPSAFGYYFVFQQYMLFVSGLQAAGIDNSGKHTPGALIFDSGSIDTTSGRRKHRHQEQ